MDIATLVGILTAFGMMAYAVIAAGASFGAFYDLPSALVVVGGALGALMMSFPLKTFLGTGGVIKVAFFNKQHNIANLIETIVDLAETARRDGLLALETKLEDVDHPFIVLGIQMAVDGSQPEVIEDVMRTEMEAVSKRHTNGKSVLDQFGRMAPAFGMIGTLMGLIIMLGNMSDPSSIGPAMAVALITTMYGAIVANAFAIPLADKLMFINKQEAQAMEIIIRGIMSIQAGDNPRVIEQRLNTYLPPKLRAGNQEKAA